MHVERQKENGKTLFRSLTLKLREKKFKDGLIPSSWKIFLV